MVNRPSALDRRVELIELVNARDLEDVAASFAELHATSVSLIDRSGRLLCATGEERDCHQELLTAELVCGTLELGGGGFALRPLLVDGRRLAWIAVGPGVATQLQTVAHALERVFGVVIHAALARHLTSTVHDAAMADSFAELTAKNERLERAVERMQEVDRLKSNFLATMSHELRTPLTSVIGYSEMLIEGLAGELGEEQRDYVRTILGKADQLLQLITGILDASLLEAGELDLSPAPVGLCEVIDSVVATFAPQAQKRGVEVSVVHSRVPRVLGDARKIRQVVWNLLANAIKFTPAGGRVEVRAEVGPLRRGADVATRLGLRLYVSDSGIGISPEKLAHIFEPFFQVDSSSTREYGGTGLGLTLAKSYVEAHGGMIWCESTLGSGSVFIVSLPTIADELAASSESRDG